MIARRVLSHWPLVFAVTFAALAIPLLWSLHSSQTNLRAAIDHRILDDSNKRAQTISDFVSNLKQTAIDLAASREIDTFHINRALGMSPRYGLNANIEEIRQYFQRRLNHQAKFGGKSILRSITFFDQAGAPLVRFGSARQPNGETATFEPSIAIFAETSGSRIVASAPVLFKERFAGSVVLEIEPNILSRLLNSDSATNGKHQEILLSADGSSTVANDLAPYTTPTGLALLEELPDGKLTHIRSAARFGISGNVIGLRWQIDGTPLSFVSFQSESDAYGQLASSVHFYAFAILSSIIFLAACLIEAMRRKTLVLETEFSDATRRRNELKQHNKRLEDEIEKRRIAESELHRKTEELDRLNADLKISAAAFDAQDAMIITDASGTILRVNRSFCAMTGYSPTEVVGRKPDAPNSRGFVAEFLGEMWEAVNRTGSWQAEIIDETKTGERYTRWLTASSVRDISGVVTHFIGTYHDLTEKKKAEQKINELAFYDQLTGLPNRALLLDRARQSLAENERCGQYGALLFIDLDNFKTLNDTLGHHVGDLQLKQVAERLLNCVRAEDTVARFGGDEFVVLLPKLGANESEAAVNGEGIAEKVLSALRQTYHLSDCDHLASCSIGVTVFGKLEQGVDELLKRADLAMYGAKNSGRNAIRFFEPRMQQLVSERAHMEAELRAGVERNEFVMLLQPQVDGRGEIVGSEALIRWHHPIRGVIMPSEFISVAESSGLIVSIGQFVLEAACRQLAVWSSHFALQKISIAINVSAAQIHDERFVENVLELIDRTGVDPMRVKLELTESILVRSVHEIIEKMRQLQAVGISFSLDDFGTGYSSLSYLKRLPLKQLKIDREFVKDILVDANDAAIARMIVALGRSLELDVIAEGVETSQQRDYLDDLGCRSYQGYLFGRPMPVSEFEEAVRRSGQTADQLQSVPTEADYTPYVIDAKVQLAPDEPLMLSSPVKSS